MFAGSSTGGATQPPSLDEVVVLHFVALVQKAGRLLELDGNKPFPIDHGASSPETLLQVQSASLGDSFARCTKMKICPFGDAPFLEAPALMHSLSLCAQLPGWERPLTDSCGTLLLAECL